MNLIKEDYTAIIRRAWYSGT